MKIRCRWILLLGLLFSGKASYASSDLADIGLFEEKTSGAIMFFVYPRGWHVEKTTDRNQKEILSSKNAAGVPLLLEYGVSVLRNTITAEQFLEDRLENAQAECEKVLSSSVRLEPNDSISPAIERAIGCARVKGKDYGYVAIWRSSVKGKAAFYSRYTWSLPPFDGQYEWPLSQQEMKDAADAASFFVCIDGQGTSCDDASAAVDKKSR